MDRFTIMNTFAQVVRSGSLTMAAQSLGISRPLVSRHLAVIEEHLGVELIRRTTRAIHLTPAGRKHFQFCEKVLKDLRAEESSIVSLYQAAEGALRVISPKWIGSLDIADAVASFAETRPKIRVELHLGGLSVRTYDFLAHGFDVALQTKDIPDSSVIAKKVASMKFAVYASPGYIATHGEPANLTELKSHTCLIQMNEPAWHFGTGRRIKTVKVTTNFAANSFRVLHHGTMSGIGIALLPRRIAEASVKSGELVEILCGDPVPDRPLFAVFAPGERAPRKIRELVDFLTHWFVEHPMQ
ncbi:MAG TPA: LysR family transcriptional regulator [Stellaceae bacterium]|nr:LysR family transcriptional regulator [Stellaceae bacterium]